MTKVNGEIMSKKMEFRGYSVWNLSRIYLNIGKAYYDLGKEIYIYNDDEKAEVEALILKFNAEEKELLEKLQESFFKFSDMKRRLRKRNTMSDFEEKHPDMKEAFADDYAVSIISIDSKAIAVEFGKDEIVVR